MEFWLYFWVSYNSKISKNLFIATDKNFDKRDDLGPDAIFLTEILFVSSKLKKIAKFKSQKDDIVFP